MEDNDFWLALDRLVDTSTLIVDRPKDSPHPRHPSWSYPLHYGYLEGTRAPDGAGIDVWIGSFDRTHVAAIIVTVDLDKGDAELKLLLGCTGDEARMALDTHNQGSQAGILVTRSRKGEESTHV